jgi:hypothetical protein
MKFSSPSSRYRVYLVLLLVLAVLFAPLYLIEHHVMKVTGGIFMYPLDDTFIHMAVAKDIALHGNWGVSGNEFQSASSSPLYTVILAALFKLFSGRMILPFLINLVAGAALLVVIRKWLAKENIPAVWQLLILLAVVFLTPLSILIMTGMEHTLQCLFSFLFVFHFSDWAGKKEKEADGRWQVPWPLYMYGMLVSSIRYEGLFLVGTACLILLFKRKIGQAFLLGFLSALPVIVFGAYSIAHGSYFLPNSVLIKSGGPQFSVGGMLLFLTDVILPRMTISLDGISTVAAQRLLIILPLSYIFFYRQLRQDGHYRYILIFLMVATLLQDTLASTGWFYRYEAYLILMSVTILFVLGYKYRSALAESLKKASVVKWCLVIVLFLPLFGRSLAAFRKASQACVNIYEQQYQMAMFLHKYYDQDVVGVNDIGAVSFFKQKNNLDLWGLADIKVARSKRNNYWTPPFLDSLSRAENVRLAIVFDSWFSDSLLARWSKVATWTIPNNVICGDSTVSFYTIDKNNGDDLRKNLVEYQSSLPQGVRVRYYK